MLLATSARENHCRRCVRKNMNRAKCILLGLACCALSGCGMLATPHRVTIPHESMQKIIVLDQDTKQPLAGASVTCQMSEYKNWMKPVPFWGVTNPTNVADDQVTDRPDRKVWSWQAEARGHSTFFAEQRKKTGWTQLWFPLPSPLGWHLYRTYHGSITASAPGYRSVWLNAPTMPTEPKFFHGEEGLTPRDFFTLTNDTLTIMLPGKKTHNKALERTPQ